jgi:hypothetical protein
VFQTALSLVAMILLYLQWLRIPIPPQPPKPALGMYQGAGWYQQGVPISQFPVATNQPVIHQLDGRPAATELPYGQGVAAYKTYEMPGQAPPSELPQQPYPQFYQSHGQVSELPTTMPRHGTQQ